ncbi:putative integral membrane protein [Streptomyces sp. L-9-10]|uniref:hypothetical protein n=1 Tax=Streptomyces sp. L-9-10 TaxID=1478131 RepID=UPI0010E5A085|nr:hypothetical protein [Streptomyces sp. L-9-10]RYJ23003.1 putative integral membrane protein [Streptomyces sp. L-9-10]
MNPTPETETADQTTDPKTAGTAASGAEPTAETTTGPKADLTKGSAAEPADKDTTAAEGPEDAAAEDAEDADDLGDDDAAAASRPSGLGSAAASIVAVCLGIVALTGTWTSRVLAERQGLVGQLKTGQSSTAEQQISAIYADGWHVTAAINGAVALVAMLVGVIVLTLPQRTGWARPVALAGAILGFLGLLVSFGMYFDLFAALPTPPAAPAPTP